MIEDIKYIEIAIPGGIVKSGAMALKSSERIEAHLMAKVSGEWKEIETLHYEAEPGEDYCVETIMREYEKINSCQRSQHLTNP